MNILVADDDPVLRRLMRELLFRHLGYAVVEAADGLKAWQALNSGLKPDVSILDLMMPGMGGLDLLFRLRGDRRFKHLKIILCSTLHDRASVAQAGSLEVEGYLVKPFTGQSFLAMVRRACATGSEPGSPPASPPAETMPKRLGIDNGLYLELVNAFTADVRDTLTRLADWPALGSRDELALRLVSARGAGLSLGAETAVNAIRRVEIALESKDASTLMTARELLVQENNRLNAAVGGTIAPLAPPVEARRSQASAPPEPCLAEPSA